MVDKSSETDKERVHVHVYNYIPIIMLFVSQLHTQNAQGNKYTYYVLAKQSEIVHILLVEYCTL